MIFSIANQPQLSLVYSSQNETDEYLQQINKKKVQQFIQKSKINKLYVIIPDLFYSLIFLFFMIGWYKHSKNVKKKYLQNHFTPSQFTLMFKGQFSKLNKKQINEDDIRKHFRQIKMNDIVQINIIKNYFQNISYLKNLTKKIMSVKQLKKQIEIKQKRGGIFMEKQRNILYKKIIQLKYQILNNQKNKTLNQIKINQEIIMVLVTFNKKFDKLYVQKTYAQYTKFSLLQRILCCCLLPKHPKQLKLFGKLSLKCQSIKDQPQSIIWQNLNVYIWQKIVRLILLWAFLLIILFVFFFLLFIINMFSPTTSKTLNMNYLPTFEEAKNANNQTITDIFCLQKSFSELYKNEELFEFCKDSIYRYFLEILLNGVIAIAICILNVILSYIVIKISKIRKFKSLNYQIKTNTWNLYIAILLNTLFLTVFMQSNIFGFQPSSIKLLLDYIKDLFNNSLIEKQNIYVYTDLQRNWYVDVGQKVIYMWVVAVFAPHFIYLISVPFIKYWMNKKMKKVQCSNQQILQKYMNKYIIGFEFPFQTYFSAILSVITISMAFSSGMPLMNVLGWVILVFRYYSYKYMIFNFYKRPPTLNHQTIKMTYIILSISLSIHLMIGIYCYTYPNIFPSQNQQIFQIVNKQLQNSGLSNLFKSNENINSIYTRYSKLIYMTGFLLLILGFYLFKNIVLKGICSIYQVCCQSKMNFNNKVYNENDQKNHFMNIIPKIQKKMLVSYNLKNNEFYKEMINLKESSKNILSQILQ